MTNSPSFNPEEDNNPVSPSNDIEFLPADEDVEAALIILQQPMETVKHRLEALLTVLHYFAPEHNTVLQQIIADDAEDPEIRSAIALILGKLSSPEALAILKNQVNTEHPVVRRYVVQSLGSTGLKEAIPYLVAALEDADNDVFASASEAFSSFGQDALDTLIELLGHTKADVRCIAAWNLGEIADTASVTALLKTVNTDDNEEVIALCIWALGQVGQYSDELMLALNKAAKHEHPEIRLRAEVALKKIARHLN